MTLTFPRLSLSVARTHVRADIDKGKAMINRSFALLGASMLAVVVTGCQGQAGTANEDAGKTTAAIQADEKAWNEQFKSKNMEGLIGHYADDAFLVAPGGKPASGSTAIRKVLADAGSDQNFQLQFGSDKIEAAGDLAYSRGHFTEQYTDRKTGKVMTDSGSYLTVYKKQGDGSWKSVEDFVVADPGSAKAVEPGKPATRAKMVSF